MTSVPLLALFSNESTDKVCTNMKIKKVMSASVSCFILVYNELLIEVVSYWPPFCVKKADEEFHMKNRPIGNSFNI
jgi:hypothetical protein